MRLRKIIFHLSLLFTIPSFVLYPITSALASLPAVSLPTSSEITKPKDLPSYDELLELIDTLTEEELANRFTEEELARINEFITSVAKEGQLPGEDVSLEEDINELLCNNLFLRQDSYTILPAICLADADIYLCKHKIRNFCRATKKFFKKHKKAIIIGAAILTGVGIVVCAAVAISSISSGNTPKKENPPAPPPAINPVEVREEAKKAPILNENLNEHIANFKETIVREGFMQQDVSKEQLSMLEQGRVLGSLFAHEMHKDLAKDFTTSGNLALELQNLNIENPYGGEKNKSFAHQEIDQKFATDYAPLYANANGKDFNALSYELLGEKAFQKGFYQESIEHFQKASEKDPKDPLPYLGKSMAHYNSKEYDKSIEAYHVFTAHTKKSALSVPEFSLAFAQGLPKGIHDSADGLFLLFSDLIRHPIETASQMWDALNLLSSLVKSRDWDKLSAAVAPEIHDLVKNWDTMSSKEKGELSGYVFGKYGADIIIPGALAKITAEGIKGAQELAVIGRGLKTAEQTLCLETVAGIGDGAKVAEVVANGQKNITLAKELGLSTHEILELKEVGKLEEVISNNLERAAKDISIQSLNFYQKEKLLTSATKLYDQNLSKLAHSFSKHAGRHPEVWGKICGPMNSWHEQALKHLNELCNFPIEFIRVVDSKTGLAWFEKRLPDGRGIRLNLDYTFKGFID